MPANQISRRARLRAKALGETFPEAREHITRMNRHDPLFPAPSRGQAKLEGFLALHGLEYLHHLAQPEDTFPFDLTITRLKPARDRLSIWAQPADLEHMTIGLLPSCDLMVHGAVGIRVRSHHGDLEVYDVQLAASSVVFVGYPAADYANTHLVMYGEHDHCILARPADRLTSVEQAHLTARAQRLGRPLADIAEGEHWVASSLLRRLGVLTQLDLRSVTCHATFDQVKVEIEALTESGKQAALDALGSSALSPRWTLREHHPGMGLASSHLFAVDGTDSTVLLRFSDLYPSMRSRRHPPS